jgi:NCS1 family nucleobase:cation symporter-1
MMQRVKRIIQVKETEEMRRNDGGKLWTNQDLAPSPPEARGWKFWSYFVFQFSVSFSPTTYSTGASLVAVGLTWWHIFIAAWIGSFLVCVLFTLNSQGPARYHVGFPSFIRISAGLYGSLFWVFIRGAVAILFTATQTFYSGRLMDTCLRCIFGDPYQNMPNYLPASSGTTSRQLLAFFVLWFLQLPFMFVHPSKTRKIFAAKSIIVSD